MRRARAVIPGLPTALALSGCMGRSGPVAAVQPQSDLDALAYGQPVPPSYPPSQVGYQPPVVYAGPPPAAYDQQYRLDAGDRLLVRGSIRAVVPLDTPLGPGDTILVGERWF
jgi:polysaccharide export outer membrane protein